MHDKYDLVKVINADDNQFYGAIGIIKGIDEDIDGNTLYELIFAGRHHNKVSNDIPLFYANELEGI